MASLYIVAVPDAPLPRNTIVRKFDDGYEKCVMEMEGGRNTIQSYTGIVLPHSILDPYVLPIGVKERYDVEGIESRRRSAERIVLAC